MEGMLPPLVAFMLADIGQFKMKMAEAAGIATATTAGTASKFQMLATAGKVAMIAAAATIALVAGAAFELEKHAEEAGQAAFEMSEKFGLSGKQASLWIAIGGRIGVSTGQVSTAFRFLTRNMENINLAMKAHAPTARALMEAHEKMRLATEHYNAAMAKTVPGSVAAQAATLAYQRAQDSFSKTMEGAKGKLSPVGQAFQTLGISIYDSSGKLRSANDVMKDAVIAFGKMPAGVEKAGLAMKIFGRSGQNLLPLLNQGKAGLDALSAAALKSGIVMENDQVKSAHDAFLAHKAFDQAVGGLANQLAVGLLPVAVKVFGWLANTAVPAIQNAVNWTKQHTEVIKIVGAAIAGPLLLAIGAYIVSMGLAAAATLAAMWPILLIIGALALVGVAIYLVISHWKQISETVKRVAGELWTNAVGIWNRIWGAVTNIVGGIVATISKAAQAFHDRPFYWLTRLSLLPVILLGIFLGHVIIWSIQLNALAVKAGHDFFTWLAYWIGKLPGMAQTFLLNMLNTVLMFPIKFNKAATDIGTSIWKAIKGFDWSKLAYDLLEGFRQGLINGVGALLGTVKNIGGQILQGFKDAFGIHSPSLVMAAQIGGPIAQGVGVGILGEAPSAIKAMKSLVGGVIDAGRGQAVTPGIGTSGVAIIASGASGGRSGSGATKMEEMREMLEVLKEMLITLQAISAAGDTGLLDVQLRAALVRMIGQALTDRRSGVGMSPAY